MGRELVQSRIINSSLEPGIINETGFIGIIVIPIIVRTRRRRDELAQQRVASCHAARSGEKTIEFHVQPAIRVASKSLATVALHRADEQNLDGNCQRHRFLRRQSLLNAYKSHESITFLYRDQSHFHQSSQNYRIECFAIEQKERG